MIGECYWCGETRELPGRVLSIGKHRAREREVCQTCEAELHEDQRKAAGYRSQLKQDKRQALLVTLSVVVLASVSVLGMWCWL